VYLISALHALISDVHDLNMQSTISLPTPQGGQVEPENCRTTTSDDTTKKKGSSLTWTHLRTRAAMMMAMRVVTKNELTDSLYEL